jgi:hypothetical protein
MTTGEFTYNQAAMYEAPAVEFVTITGLFENKRYIAIFRKWFNERLSAWELDLVPGTLRWIDKE